MFVCHVTVVVSAQVLSSCTVITLNMGVCRAVECATRGMAVAIQLFRYASSCRDDAHSSAREAASVRQVELTAATDLHSWLS